MRTDCKFLVLRKNGGSYTLTEVCLRIKIEHNDQEVLCRDLQTGLDAHYRNRDGVVKLLVWLGWNVRFFDEEEKEWVDVSKEEGSVTVKGNRDGSWGRPTKEEFERDYLQLSKE